jgi:(2Fe-2S) ferredoxin
VKTIDDLARIREQARKAMHLRESHRYTLVVPVGDCGLAAGARNVTTALVDELEKHGITDAAVLQSDCIGMCEHEPLVLVQSNDAAVVTYERVTNERARTIVARHIARGEVINDWVVKEENLG